MRLPQTKMLLLSKGKDQQRRNQQNERKSLQTTQQIQDYHPGFTKSFGNSITAIQATP